jgi:ubiquinone biosynthesis monooxygenase Coq7
VNNETGSRILKVNHAGENGAVHIYSGQILAARLSAPAMVAELMAFREHEKTHRAIFLAELERRGRPRCRSYWLCGAGGWLLGVLTGLCGRAMIAATTVAVERVVLRHLARQLIVLQDQDMAAAAAIAAIIADERQHLDHSTAHLGKQGLPTRMLGAIVTASTETVIWLGMRI